MVVKILRWLAVLPASALAYCLSWVIALAIRNQIFYDEMFGLFYGGSGGGLAEFIGSIIVNSAASACAIMAAAKVAPSNKFFVVCLTYGLTIIAAVMLGIVLASTATTIGLVISAVFVGYNCLNDDWDD